jgi:uncharacterized protein (DUF427 family)
VLYIPIEDLKQKLLRSSGQHTYRPCKGEASCFDSVTGEDKALQGAISYCSESYPAVSAIVDRVASTGPLSVPIGSPSPTGPKMESCHDRHRTD